MNYLQLNFLDVLEKYPNSVKKIISWFLSREDINIYLKRENPKVTPNEIVEIVKNMVSMVIQHDPRKLYDPFDSMGIIISVYQDINAGNFVWTNNKSHSSSSADNRIEAESAALLAAFEYLENNPTD